MTGPVRNPVAEPKESIELSKLVAERDKLVEELEQLRGAALTRKELQAKHKNEAKKAAFELRELRRQAGTADEREGLQLQKLRVEAKNARSSQYFDLLKILIPALSIVATAWVATKNLTYQQNKDRASEVSQQLTTFNKDMENDDDFNKQRIAVSAVRSLGGHAVPSLVAHLELKHHAETIAALQVAILELDRNPELRLPISRELLHSTRYIALSRLDEQDIDLFILGRLIDLWRQSYRQFEGPDRATARDQANQLADELTSAIRVKFPNGGKKPDSYVEAVNRLRPEM